MDKHPAPGGHQNDAYGFVHLCQPFLLHSAASKGLEGNWLKLALAKQMHALFSRTPFPSESAESHKKYVTLGCGKTGMDAVVFLQCEIRVHLDGIGWVVPKDVWMLSRGQGSPYDWAKALVQKGLDFDKAALHLECEGKFVRLDADVLPTRF